MIKVIVNTVDGAEQCKIDVACMTRTTLIGEAAAAIAAICKSVTKHVPEVRPDDLFELAIDVAEEQ